ncbi:aromatic compound dioxygenase [Rhizodiscina lignyota]|uniref:Aromatic compound dioxygenase n=1 Tax=Rhizodiscina lignyota TaxID=1504668 RepID=A0A9P4M2Y4_9PEZI|nr:aromatic compound dioxygenase [Rhizodiscina lignyota]
MAATGENESLEDLTADNLTQHVINICTRNAPDDRTKELVSGLIQHLHDYVREVRLRTGEWETGWQYLTEVGQFCTPERQEMILLSDVLGVSALVDAINSAQAQSVSATESSVLGPFHNEAHVLENGESIGSEGVIGEPMLIHGTVKATDGTAIEGVTVDVWETNGNGFYDMQDPSRDGPDCRGVFRTDSEGRFYLIGVKSVDYNIPDDGPIGVMLRHLGRNQTRPAHVHFQIKHPAYIDLTTALYSRDSKNVATDPVFGVKKSLIKDFQWSEELPAVAKGYNLESSLQRMNVQNRKGLWVLEHDFVLLRK